MKQFFLLFCVLLIHSFVFAGKYQKVKIIMKNGTELNGMATLPENPAPMPILFKENDDAKPQKITSDSIRTLSYFLGNNKTIEFDRMDVYVDGSKKKPEKLWLIVSRRGRTTLYICDGLDIIAGVGVTINKFQRHWLCYRPGEDAATIIASTSSKNKRDAFVQQAVEYFKDDTELTKKIESNQYKWDDMEKLVDEYNEWKEKNH